MRSLMEGMTMFLFRRLAGLPVVASLVLGPLSLSACATEEYVNSKIAEVDQRVSAVDAKASAAEQKADEAGQRADAANSAAQQAQASAQQALAAAGEPNSKIEALGGRVDSMEQQLAANKAPRN